MFSLALGTNISPRWRQVTFALAISTNLRDNNWFYIKVRGAVCVHTWNPRLLAGLHCHLFCISRRRWNQPACHRRGCESDLVGAASSAWTRGDAEYLYCICLLYWSFKDVTVFLFCVPSVHVVQVSGCSHGVRELPHGHGPDTQAGRHRQPLSRQVTLRQSLPKAKISKGKCYITASVTVLCWEILSYITHRPIFRPFPPVFRSGGSSAVASYSLLMSLCSMHTTFFPVTSCIPIRTGRAGTTAKMRRPPAGTENMNSCLSPTSTWLKRSRMSCLKVSTRLYSRRRQISESLLLKF